MRGRESFITNKSVLEKWSEGKGDAGEVFVIFDTLAIFVIELLRGM